MPCGPRVRHALRVGLGGCALAWLAQTGATTGCISSVLFYISTVAGTPEYLQGFVLQSAANTFYGALAAAGLSAAALTLAAGSRAAAFFLFLPPACFLAAMRTDRAILPLPLVAIVFTGFIIIPNVDAAPAPARAASLAFAREAALALAVSVATQLLLPDLAAAAAERTLAAQARAAGHALSSAATRVLSVACSAADTRPAAAAVAGDAAPAWSAQSAEPRSSSAVRENADWERVTPPGLRRVANYAAMARARVLLAAAEYEPLLPGYRGFRRCTPAAGAPSVHDAMEVVINKVASLESAAFVAHCRGPGAHFSRDYLVMLLGEDLLPVYMEHFAGCAAVCHDMSQRFSATAKDVGAVQALRDVDLELDARSKRWEKRREAMYSGFTTQFQLYWKKRGAMHLRGAALPDQSLEEILDASDSGDEAGDGSNDARGPAVVRGSEIRSIIFIAVTSHALCMALADLQSSVLASREYSWHVLYPFRMFWLPLPPAARRFWTVLRLRLKPWELRFVATHVALLGTVMGIIMFANVLTEDANFKMSQLAWVYASAGLSAQLSVESTLFIGLLRVAATIAGCASAYGVSLAVKAAGSRLAEYALGPYFAAIVVSALLLLPPKFRYAAFLFIVTNALVIFCPRGSDDCLAARTTLDASCFPGFDYALTRAVNVSIGVVLAVAFHSLLWPRFAQDSARRCLAQVYNGATDLFAAVHRKYRELGDKAKFAEKSSASGNLGNGNGATSQDREPRRVPSGEYRLQLEDPKSEELIKGVGLDELNACARRLVREPLDRALLLLKADASVWDKGKLALPDVLKELPEHFVSLSVSITEMASILGRRPVLSGHYHSTAHAIFIVPLAYEHETLLVSLFHLGKTVQELLRAQDSPRALASLQCAIRHLKQTLRLIHSRVSSLRKAIHSQRLSVANASSLRAAGDGESGVMHVDDIVLYNAFSFASNACAAAFLSIADLCERNIGDLLRSRSLKIRAKLQ